MKSFSDNLPNIDKNAIADIEAKLNAHISLTRSTFLCMCVVMGVLAAIDISLIVTIFTRH